MDEEQHVCCSEAWDEERTPRIAKHKATAEQLQRCGRRSVDLLAPSRIALFFCFELGSGHTHTCLFSPHHNSEGNGPLPCITSLVVFSFMFNSFNNIRIMLYK